MILREVQDEAGHISGQTVTALALALGIPRVRVKGWRASTHFSAASPCTVPHIGKVGSQRGWAGTGQVWDVDLIGKMGLQNHTPSIAGLLGSGRNLRPVRGFHLDGREPEHGSLTAQFQLYILTFIHHILGGRHDRSHS